MPPVQHVCVASESTMVKINLTLPMFWQRCVGIIKNMHEGYPKWRLNFKSWQFFFVCALPTLQSPLVIFRWQITNPPSLCSAQQLWLALWTHWPYGSFIKNYLEVGHRELAIWWEITQNVRVDIYKKLNVSSDRLTMSSKDLLVFPLPWINVNVKRFINTTSREKEPKCW